MDYEEKYKQALETVQEILSSGADAIRIKRLKLRLQSVFPELAESEDEKIRKGLIDYFTYLESIDKTVLTNIENNKILAWLEKQCGRAKFPDSSYTTDKSVIEFADEYSRNVWEKLMANFNDIDGYSIGCNDVSDIVLNAIIDACNWNKTMTQKEKDLEDLFQTLPEKIVDEKSHQVYELCVYHYDGQCVVDYVGEIDHDSLYTFGGDTLYDAIEKAWNWLRKNSTGG